ncbi:DUF6221 family protein [Streptomyces griseofuscus]|uniref:DUF6221 family protein n=1 Tax=Streptomyces griseofuscus TaxID=146922 RepID=UPI0033DFA6F4
MTEQRPAGEGTATAAEWAAFLEARVREESDADSGVEQSWWEVTGPGARRFGVQTAEGRVFAPILTGGGVQADQATAVHIVRTQPRRTRDDLTAKLMLASVLRHAAAEDSPLAEALLLIVQKFASPFRDHPDHPAPEET